MTLLSALNPFRRQNKGRANHVRSVNAAGAWPDDPRMTSPSRDYLAAAQTVGQRAAGLDINDAIIRSAIDQLVSMIVGTGTRANTSDAGVDRRFNERMFDPSGRKSLLAIQQEFIRSWAIHGEGLAMFGVLDSTLILNVLHPDQLDRTKNEDLGGGRRIIAGVELDEYDRRVAFWITPPSDTVFGLWQPAERIEAVNIIHVFEVLTPGQVRGISPLTPILPLANTASIAVEAGLKKLQVAALVAGIITSPDGTDPFDANKTPSLEPGAMIRLNPGETFEGFEGGDAGDLPGFLKVIYHQMAAAIGTTYEDLTGDLSGVNYSSYRAGHLNARRRAEARRKVLLIDGFLQRVFRVWAAIETLAGFPVTVEPAWIEPRWPEIDSEKEANADVTLLDAGLTSRKRVVEGRGMEFEAVDAEIKADKFTPRQTQKAGAA